MHCLNAIFMWSEGALCTSNKNSNTASQRADVLLPYDCFNFRIWTCCRDYSAFSSGETCVQCSRSKQQQQLTNVGWDVSCRIANSYTLLRISLVFRIFMCSGLTFSVHSSCWWYTFYCFEMYPMAGILTFHVVRIWVTPIVHCFELICFLSST